MKLNKHSASMIVNRAPWNSLKHENVYFLLSMRDRLAMPCIPEHPTPCYRDVSWHRRIPTACTCSLYDAI